MSKHLLNDFMRHLASAKKRHKQALTIMRGIDFFADELPLDSAKQLGKMLLPPESVTDHERWIITFSSILDSVH